MNHNYLSLEIEFEVEQLHRELVQQPKKAHQLALNYYKDYLVLARQYRVLNERFQALLNTQSSPPLLPPVSGKKNRSN